MSFSASYEVLYCKHTKDSTCSEHAMETYFEMLLVDLNAFVIKTG